MSRFRNTTTEVVVSVDDSKDDRYTDGWEPAPAVKTPPAKRASSKSNEK